MASHGALGIRRKTAIERIEAACGAGLVLPLYSRYGNDVLLVLQLEAIAHFLDTHSIQGTAPNSTTPYEGTAIQELMALARGRGISFSPRIGRDTLVQRLQEWDRTQQEAV